MFSVTKLTPAWFIFSGILVVGSIVLFFLWGLVPGIDFRGGALAEVTFKSAVNPQDVNNVLTREGFGDVVVQSTSDQSLIIKTKQIAEADLPHFHDILTKKFGEYKEDRFESIGPTIGRELIRKAYWQIILVNLGILFYLAYSFRKIGKLGKSNITPWRMGVAALIALFHDLAVTVGLFVILGKFRGVEIDSLFITAILTILGFSVHDTIVVFDRIRENLQVYKYKPLSTIIDFSVVSTMARSLNTSSTLIFILIALLLFGGQSIFYFVLALLVGVTIGTYSSIFVASPILHIWERFSSRK